MSLRNKIAEESEGESAEVQSGGNLAAEVRSGGGIAEVQSGGKSAEVQLGDELAAAQLIRRWNAQADDFAAQLAAMRRPPNEENVRETAANIIRRVREEGDAALLELTTQLDKQTFSSVENMFLTRVQMESACSDIAPSVLTALKDAAQRIREYHLRQKPESWEQQDEYGNTIGERFLPVSRAAVYAPGGRAVYPSSVLMGVIPAKVAGVEDVLLVTPPGDNTPPPVVLAAAAVAGADGVLLLGGAQAVAALTFGTKSIARADVFVGPGNAYLAEAKRQLSGFIGMDSIAGPSEVLIVADRSANPDWVAADMLAQAEHAPDAQSILVSNDENLLNAVEQALAVRLEKEPRKEIIKQSLLARGMLILTADLNECCTVANMAAAEHVQVMCDNAKIIAQKIRNVGGLFIGAYSCTALGDYGAGPNHVLPTAGTARFSSPLGVGNFQKRTGILHVQKKGAAPLVQTTMQLAKTENLPAHAASAKLRGE